MARLDLASRRALYRRPSLILFCVPMILFDRQAQEDVDPKLCSDFLVVKPRQASAVDTADQLLRKSTAGQRLVSHFPRPRYRLLRGEQAGDLHMSDIVIHGHRFARAGPPGLIIRHDEADHLRRANEIPLATKGFGDAHPARVGLRRLPVSCCDRAHCPIIVILPAHQDCGKSSAPGS